jgi:DHA1 family bicyclomycin/chloramphenicol resistance-like MFS transporter
MFYILAGINAVLALAVWVAVPETLPEERRHAGGMRATGRAFRDLARDRVFVGYALTVAFAYASLFGYIAGSSFVCRSTTG